MTSTVPPDKKENYERLFAGCLIKEPKYPEIDGIIAKMIASKSRYESVAVRNVFVILPFRRTVIRVSQMSDFKVC